MSLSLKVRVMPRCWYVLMRFWLRVDNVLIRLRETRFFCKMTPGAGAEPVLPPGFPEEKRAALLASLAAGPARTSRLQSHHRLLASIPLVMVPFTAQLEPRRPCNHARHYKLMPRRCFAKLPRRCLVKLPRKLV